ncbi:MAG: ACT domain-containing protein [Firmicutes bacterium]|nr:ACT domain-containing protein [Bacillota bacterium]
MKAVVTVIGKDKTGIIASVTGELHKLGANVEDISQTILQEYFVMTMLVSCRSVEFEKLSNALSELAKKVGVDIKAMHEDLFNVMHRI